MATHIVRGPDGTAYKVTAPEGATQEEILAYAQRQAAAQSTPPPAPLPELGVGDVLMGGTRNFMQGVTLGAADELEAAIGYGLGKLGLQPEASFEDIRRGIENQRLSVSQQNPTLSLGMEMLGAAAPAVLTAGQSLPVSAGPFAGRAPSLGRQVLSGTGTGALTGGVTAYNKAEGDTRTRAIEGLSGATAGATLGAGVPLGMAAGGKGIDFLKSLWRGQSPEAISGKANELILKSLERDQIAPATAAEAAARLEDIGVPNVMLPEVAGRATTQRLSAAANYPGGGINQVSDDLIKNVQNQSILLPQFFSEAAGIPRVNSTAVVESILARRKAVAGPLYDKAYFVDAQGQIPRYVKSPEVQSLLKLPQFQKAADEATELLAAEGAIPVGAKVTLTPTVQNLDRLKRGLDRLIAKETDPVTGKVTDLGRAYIDSKNRYLKAIDDAVPEFKAARAAYAGDTEAANSIRLGRRVIEAGEDEWRAVGKELLAMPPSNRALAAYGVLDELGIQLERAAKAYGDKAPDLTRIVTGARNARRLESFIPSMADRKLFRERVAALERKATVKNAVVAGSRTAPLAAEMQDMTGGPTSGALSSLAVGNPLPKITQDVAQWITNRREGVTEQVAREMASKLTLTGKPLQDYLASLAPYQRKLYMDAMGEARRRATAAGVAGYFGGSLPTVNKRPSPGPATRPVVRRGLLSE